MLKGRSLTTIAVGGALLATLHPVALFAQEVAAAAATAAGAAPLVAAAQAAPPVEISGADTAWMLVSTALVLLMTPALGFFYGGLVRQKNFLNTLMMSFAALGVVAMTWTMVGYSLAFAPGSSFVGGLDFMFLKGVGLTGAPAAPNIPHVLYMVYQATFAIITAALISGAVVERMAFGPYLAFIALWSVVVYAPIAHWVWGGGWLGSMGALDFAGGTVVHVNAGIAAVVAAILVGQRKDYGRKAHIPHNVPHVLLGAGLLWFGWFGFNGGSAVASNGIAALAFANTMLAPAATLVVWMILDTLRSRKITAVGAATGIVIGLVAITPAAGFIAPISAIALGALAAFPSYFVIMFRSRTRLDDSLDVWAAHGTGGVVGAILTGVFASQAWGGKAGPVDGNAGQILTQLVAIAGALVYSGVATFVLLKVISLFTNLRRSHAEEGIGLDVVLHGEEAYAKNEGAVLVHPDAVAVARETTTPDLAVAAR